MSAKIPYDHTELLTGLKKLGLTQQLICDELGVSQSTISRWNKGAYPELPNYYDLIDLARRYGVIEHEHDPEIAVDVRNGDGVNEIDVVGGLGSGRTMTLVNSARNGITFSAEAIRDVWKLPSWVLNRFNVSAQHLICFPCQGDSMSPTIVDGDVVFIDTRHTIPSPPGIYALLDEWGGLVVKRCEVVSKPSDERKIIRISSDNQHYREKELGVDEINIVGRYICRVAF